MARFNVRGLVMGACLLFAVGLRSQAQTAAPDSPTASGAAAASPQSVVPRLIKFNGVLRDAAGKPLSGPLTVTFALYSVEAGGDPLWFETQSVQADEQGRYTSLIGAMHTDGLPMDLFTSGEARWLGVQVGTEAEQKPRVLLLSVPYALKAADAETLGGMPPSAFVRTDVWPTTSGAGVAGAAGTPVGSYESAGGTSQGKPPGPLSMGISGLLTITADNTGGYNASTQLMIQGTTNNNNQQLLIGYNTANDVGYIQADKQGTGYKPLLLSPNGGNVGIGTTSPGAGLQVGPWSSKPANVVFSGLGTILDGDLFVGNNANPKTRIYNSGGLTAVQLNDYYNGSADVAQNTNWPAWQAVLAGYPPGSLDYFAIERAAPTTGSLAYSTFLYINSSGNLGIGTATPARTLEVNGTSLFDNDMFTYQSGGIFFSGSGSYGAGVYSRNSGNDLVFNANGSEKMRLSAAGNVGIGTTAPAATLDVHGTGNFTGLVTFASGQTFAGAATLGANTFTGSQTVTGNVSASGNLFVGGSPSGMPLEIQAGGHDALTVASGGNVTVGSSTSPTHVTMAAANTDFAGQIAINSGTSGYYQFSTPFTGQTPNVAPVCVVTPTTNMGNVSWYINVSPTQLWVYLSGAATVTFNYICVGNPN